jgi:arabinogalactan endo-1,4-beta-galactosidase
MANFKFEPRLMFDGKDIDIIYQKNDSYYSFYNNEIYCDIKLILKSKGISKGRACIYGLPYLPAEDKYELLEAENIKSIEYPYMVRAKTDRNYLEIAYCRGPEPIFQEWTDEDLTDTSSLHCRIYFHYKS